MPYPDDKLPEPKAIQAYINSCEKPPKLRDIARHFGLSAQMRPELRALLHQLASENNQQPDHMTGVHLIEITNIDSDGTGFAQLAGQKQNAPADILILPTAKNAKALIVGARCLAQIDQKEGTFYAQIMRVLPKHRTRLFGRAFRNDKKDSWMVEPAEKGGKRPVILQLGASQSLQENDVIEAELIQSRRSFPTARLLRVIAQAGTSESYIELAIAEGDLPHLFSDEMLEQAASATLPPVQDREDLTDMGLVTIDGEDAKDFDDAVFAEPVDQNNWRLIVAIADVAFYVQEGSALDVEARRRGNSVYLPGFVIPMLPEALSNGLCSLRPQEDRACLAVEIIIDDKGKKLSHRFFRGIMRSCARLTYTSVQHFMDGKIDEPDLGVPNGSLHHLAAVYHLLRSARDKRGALNLDIPEKKMLFSQDGHIKAVQIYEQKPAHQLIEEMMILANVCAAETLEEKRTLCIYRVHDQPDPEKMDVLRELSTGLKINLPKGEVITPHKFNQIIAAAKDTALAPAISDAILRCQARAVYSPENSGHYGLGLSRYAHFTSPIRRYSDLMVHRGLIAGLQLGNEAHETDFNKAAEICKHISLTEQRAAKAERRTIARMAASLLQEQTGTIVDTTITGVTNAGLFVSLDKEGAEGFVSRRSLPEDYYETDDFHLSLVGAYSRWHFTIGDKLQCRIEKVSSASGDIDLSWQAGGIQKMADKTSRKKRRAGKPRRAGKHRRSSR